MRFEVRSMSENKRNISLTSCKLRRRKKVEYKIAHFTVLENVLLNEGKIRLRLPFSKVSMYPSWTYDKWQ